MPLEPLLPLECAGDTGGRLTDGHTRHIVGIVAHRWHHVATQGLDHVTARRALPRKMRGKGARPTQQRQRERHRGRQRKHRLHQQHVATLRRLHERRHLSLRLQQVARQDREPRATCGADGGALCPEHPRERWPRGAHSRHAPTHRPHVACADGVGHVTRGQAPAAQHVGEQRQVDDRSSLEHLDERSRGRQCGIGATIPGEQAAGTRCNQRRHESAGQRRQNLAMVRHREPFVAHRGPRDGTQLHHPAGVTIIGPFHIPVGAAPPIHLRQFPHELQHTLQSLRPRRKHRVGRLTATTPRNVQPLSTDGTSQQRLRGATDDVHQVVLVLPLRKRDAGMLRVDEPHDEQIAANGGSVA